MISLLMSKQPVPTDNEEKAAYIKKLDDHIKVFLSCCNRFCTSYFDKTVTDFWMGKSNFISLLNLPEQIAHFGPLGLYYDGTFERFIQGPKKILETARKNPASLMNKLRLLQAFSFMDKIRSDLFPESNNGGKRYMGVYVFLNEQEIHDRMSEGRCLSGFIQNNKVGEIYIPYAKGVYDFGVVILSYDRQTIKTNGCGLNYSKFKVAKSKEVQINKSNLDIKGDIVDQYCLLLPFSERGRSFGCHTAEGPIQHTTQIGP